VDIIKKENILDVIRIMNGSNEEITILKYENILCRMFFSPILFVCSILNFVGMYLIFHQHTNDIITNSILLLGFFLFLELISKEIKNEKLKENILIIFFQALLVFIVIRLYYLIGSTVWTASIILVMISMVRIKRGMLITISTATCVLGMYVWYKAYPFQMGALYYGT